MYNNILYDIYIYIYIYLIFFMGKLIYRWLIYHIPYLTTRRSIYLTVIQIQAFVCFISACVV